MTRFAAMLLLGALLAAAVVAAPAPAPRASGPWFDGWDRPVDPLGVCRFQRHWDRLSITVPGLKHELYVREKRLTAPRLLRAVEGDFSAQVRVGGDFRAAEGCDWVACEAGLLLTDQKNFIWFVREAARGAPEVASDAIRRPGYCLCVKLNPEMGCSSMMSFWGPPLETPAYLRLERRGSRLTTKVSQDGVRWESATFPSLLKLLRSIKMPQKVKVGVVAEAIGVLPDASASGTYKAVFDQFKLTRLGPDGKPLGGTAP